MIKKAKNHMKKAYDHMKTMVVSHDNVQKLALAEMELELAYLALEDMEKSMKTEEKKEEQTDGQTD